MAINKHIDINIPYILCLKNTDINGPKQIKGSITNVLIGLVNLIGYLFILKNTKL